MGKRANAYSQLSLSYWLNMTHQWEIKTIGKATEVTVGSLHMRLASSFVNGSQTITLPYSAHQDASFDLYKY